MGPENIAAWTQLYAAVGLLAAICSGCALLKTIYRHPNRSDRAAEGFGAAVVAMVSEGLAAFPAELSLRVSKHFGHRYPVCALYRVCRICAFVGYEGYLAVA
jgi:hypothetical protein